MLRSILSLLKDGNMQLSADDLVQRYGEAWKIVRPYYCRYFFKRGRASSEDPPTNPLFTMLDQADRGWRALKGGKKIGDNLNDCLRNYNMPFE